MGAVIITMIQNVAKYNVTYAFKAPSLISKIVMVQYLATYHGSVIVFLLA